MLPTPRSSRCGELYWQKNSAAKWWRLATWSPKRAFIRTVLITTLLITTLSAEAKFTVGSRTSRCETTPTDSTLGAKFAVHSAAIQRQPPDCSDSRFHSVG